MLTKSFHFKAEEGRRREINLKRHQNEEKLAEIANSCFSDLLTERSDQNPFEFNCRRHRHHVLLDRWKGMTKDQCDQIRGEQLKQIDESRVRLTQFEMI